MQDILVVVDMQNDFIDGTLGSEEALAIVPKVKEKIQDFSGKTFFTQDTHRENYPDTQEGRNLPISHCIRNTRGWQIHPELERCKSEAVIEKMAFGSVELSEMLKIEHQNDPLKSITFVGLCTDICVISNAMLAKAFLPEVEIVVDASCCAGVTPKSHKTALEAMRACQIRIENEI
ncbi:MAG: cysteine hydrolase [Lachnospiraceae bacterium]|nr:cysteine hydrolase [Lachnospiraceae bacterium]